MSSCSLFTLLIPHVPFNINYAPSPWSPIQVQKVLLDGLHDPESSLNMLREPNDVRRPVMEMIWAKVTEDWQVFSNCVILTLPP